MATHAAMEVVEKMRVFDTLDEALAEYAFAGLLRGSKTEITRSLLSDLEIPARAEIVLEGHIYADDEADDQHRARDDDRR